MARLKVHGQIIQWNLIMIIYIAIQNISAKAWIDFFIYVNIHPHHRLSFPDWINNIAPAIKTGEIAYFRNHRRGGSYYDDIPSLCKFMTVINWIEVILLLIALPQWLLMVKCMDIAKYFFSQSFCFPSPNLQDKIWHMVASENPEVIEGRRHLIFTDVLNPEEAV